MKTVQGEGDRLGLITGRCSGNVESQHSPAENVYTAAGYSKHLIPDMPGNFHFGIILKGDLGEFYVMF